MTTDAPAPSRPTVVLADKAADTLLELALSLEDRDPSICRMLADEVNRAEIVAEVDLPSTAVTIGSIVSFRDGANGTMRMVQLVYPSQADISQNRISVLSPIGAGLIGLSEGQSISWPDLQGKHREFSIIRVATPEQIDD